ncbi:MAG: lipoate--protein ligase [Clostridiales Family XIII bacterium]|jgi:lipoate-protein ligase A|nr:lipoate--protein ligase [Clostridiales Family XIII bacterium]
MIYIEPKSMDAAFHFAVEEYLTGCARFDAPMLMTWQTGRTAMLGSNQVAKAEIDEAVAEENDVRVVRRRSGGGTIFTDPGSLLYTVILPWSDMADTKEILRRQVGGPIVAALTDMGIPAALEGRNDILVNGRKVSGLAQYIKGDRICSHGSLLYDTDLGLLSKVLRADRDKIRSKAIDSVRSRVANLKEYMDAPLSPAGFRSALKERLFAASEIEEYALTDREEDAVRAIRESVYGSRAWTWDKSPPYSFENSRRYAGGRLEVFLAVERGVIRHCGIRGDFMGLTPVSGLERRVEGNRFDADELARVFDRAEGVIARCLGTLTKRELLDCMFA